MAQTFNNGESNASIRSKLNANADEINDIAESITVLVPVTRTVAGKTLSADITLAKGDVGLGNVDNTSDVNKPISSATQLALDQKASTDASSLSSGILPDARLSDAIPKKVVGKIPINDLPESNLPDLCNPEMIEFIDGKLSIKASWVQSVVGGVTPAAPTDGIVDDTNNTFAFTVNPTYPDLVDYEKEINGVLTNVSTNPIIVGNINAAIGAVKVRVKAGVGRNVSAWLVNDTAFTATPEESIVLPGFTVLNASVNTTITDGTVQEINPLTGDPDTGSGVWETSTNNSEAKVFFDTLSVGVNTELALQFNGDAEEYACLGLYSDRVMIVGADAQGNEGNPGIFGQLGGSYPSLFEGQVEIGDFIIMKCIDDAGLKLDFFKTSDLDVTRIPLTLPIDVVYDNINVGNTIMMTLFSYNNRPNSRIYYPQVKNAITL